MLVAAVAINNLKCRLQLGLLLVICLDFSDFQGKTSDGYGNYSAKNGKCYPPSSSESIHIKVW